MTDKTHNHTHAAITTYGWQNHAVRTKEYRYIRYEDGSEELYDHKTDPNEWKNQATNGKYQDMRDQMRQYLPSVNEYWSTHSNYRFQPYFKAELNDWFIYQVPFLWFENIFSFFIVFSVEEMIHRIKI